MTILVTGVTGKTGGYVAESLVTRGVGVRAIVRDLERGKMATLGLAVELVEGEFDDLDSIKSAADACAGMYLVSVDGERQMEQEIEAASVAIESGVKHIVKLSSSDAGQRPYQWSVAHAKIETAIVQMDVAHSFLRPHFFMQNYLSLLKVDGNGDVTLEAPADDGLIGAIDAWDIGNCAAALLESGNALRGYSLLTGPENISMQRVAEAFSNATGREINYVNVDPIEFRAELETESSDNANDVSAVYEEVRVGRMALHSDNVEKISGRKPRSIEQFAVANVDLINQTIARASPGTNPT